MNGPTARATVLPGWSATLVRAVGPFIACPGRNEVEDPFRGWRREHV